jgi:hypothetical protein
MTALPEPDRKIRAFLDKGTVELPDRSFDAVRAAIDRTPQRTFIGPWRNRPMTGTSRLAAVAAVLVVAVIGIVVVAMPALGPAATPPPTGSTKPSSTPTPTGAAPSSAAFLPYVWPEFLEPGTYTTTMNWDLPFKVALTVPPGWQSRDIEVIKGQMSVSVQLVENTFVDPCARTLRDPVTGPSVADLAAAFETIKDIDSDPPRATWRSGFDGLALTYTPARACEGVAGLLWTAPEEDLLPAEPKGPPNWPMRPGTHDVEILDVGGTRLLIDATAGPNPTEAASRELFGVLGSLRILLAPPAQSVGECELSLAQSGGAPLVPPYQVVFGTGMSGLLGPVPVDEQGRPLVPGPPFAQVDIHGTFPARTGDPNDRPGIAAIAPADVANTGFATSTIVGGFQGSVLMDAPGTWWVRFVADAWGCLEQFPVGVLARP